MHDIKFRGKRIDNGGWVYGYFVKGATRYCILHSLAVFDAIDVDPETVGQYTGLNDPDGKEIYDGDVIDGSYRNPMSTKIVKKHYEVAYERGRYLAKLIGHHPYGSTMLYFENEHGKVIGNIHDNPELLTGGKADA